MYTYNIVFISILYLGDILYIFNTVHVNLMY